MSEELFSRQQIAERTGLSYERVKYLLRCKGIEPTKYFGRTAAYPESVITEISSKISQSGVAH